MKNEKIQYKVSVKYSDIEKIEIVACNKNSKKRNIKGGGRYATSSSVMKKYFEITLKSGKYARILIQYYTKNQILKLLGYISKGMQLAGNEKKLCIEEIMKNWYTFEGYTRLLKEKRLQVKEEKKKKQQK